MIVTVFRTRLRDESLDEYAVTAEAMERLARTMPGFVSIKIFTADDGERVAVAEFETEAQQRAWREHPEHREAQAAGRDRLYSEYRLQVCNELRRVDFERDRS